MPKLPSRCSRPGCMERKPCPKPGHETGWANNKSRPLPMNWKALKKDMAPARVFGCAWCATTFNLQLDHIVPRSEGGTDDLRNLQWLCRDHHELKTRRDRRKHA